jgi:hypothetical protein
MRPLGQAEAEARSINASWFGELTRSSSIKLNERVFPGRPEAIRRLVELGLKVKK